MAMIKHSAKALATMLFLVAPLITEGASEVATELRLSHQVPVQHVIGQMINTWAEAIERESAGLIQVKTFPGNQLMRTKSHLAGVARGHIEAALISNHDWGQTVPSMGIFSRPYGFDDYYDFKAFLANPAMNSLDQDLADKHLINLGWIWVTNTVGLTSNNHPLITPSDFNSLKIRGLNALPNAALAGLGAAPVSISGGEVYQALQSNLIQAAITTLQAVYARRYDEVQGWCVVSPMFMWAFSVTVNKSWWDSLSPAQQEIVRRHTQNLEQQSIAASREELASLPKKIIDRGMKLHVLTQGEIALQKQFLLPAWEQYFLAHSGYQGERLLNAYKQWMRNQ